MNIFIATTIISSSLSVLIYQIVKNMRYKELADEKNRLAPVILLMNSLLIFCDLIAGGQVCVRLPFDLLLGLFPMTLLTSSLWQFRTAYKYFKISLAAHAAASVCYILDACDVLVLPSAVFFRCAASVIVLCMTAMFVHGIWNHVREVRNVMKSGGIWVNLCLCVDFVYMATVLAIIILMHLLFMLSSGNFYLYACLASVLLGAAMIALDLRVANDSLFILNTRHEKRIVESMKISNVENSGDPARIESVHKAIYDRIVEYFETEKPFLSGELTINDLVKVLYTNKLYISRAISQFTGRNFCQFVNYYRVTYSMKHFRENPNLKVNELASCSGFNSVASFNMAFRLFVGEKPSDWCRKEKLIMARHRK